MTIPEITPDGVIVGPQPPRKGAMDRFIDSIEWIAAFFVGIVALNTFTAVFMRKFFAITIPDYYNFGQFMLGILIFWGIAATSHRGTHITVDLVWANVGPRMQRVIDVFATLVLLFVVSVQTYTLFDKVVTTRNDNVLTFDLNLPTWPFFAVAWAGDGGGGGGVCCPPPPPPASSPPRRAPPPPRRSRWSNEVRIVSRAR